MEIELDNPQKLNVLTFDMIKNLNKGIRQWKDRKDLSALFIHAKGERAFCAGGDVVQIRSLILQGQAEKKDPAAVTQDFFQTEYETNYILAHFPKPVILWGSGIVMGGGMGTFYGLFSSYCYRNKPSGYAGN